MEDQYPSNSMASKAPAPKPASKVQPITQATVAKPSLGKRFRAAFTGDDGRTVVQHLLWDVAIPATKAMALQMINEGAYRAMYGSNPVNRPPGSPINYAGIATNLASKINYSPMVVQQPGVQKAPPAPANPTRGHLSYESIRIVDRYMAQEVLLAMQNLVGEYGQCTLADFYGLVGKTGEYTDENFGWKDLAGSHVQHTTEGYALALPRPIQLVS